VLSTLYCAEAEFQGTNSKTSGTDKRIVEQPKEIPIVLVVPRVADLLCDMCSKIVMCLRVASVWRRRRTWPVTRWIIARWLRHVG